MKYTASIHLKQADTEGRIPASILDAYVREALVSQLGTALKPQLTIRRATAQDDIRTESVPNQVYFTTELFILQPDQWQQFKEQLRAGYGQLVTNEDESQRLQSLIDTLENNS